MNNDIDYIKQKIKITDLCRQAGIVIRQGFINCIFHDEKTPSLSIKENENFFKCFGCGESGTVIDFYMKLYKRDLKDAIKELKSLAGLDSNQLSQQINKNTSIEPSYKNTGPANEFTPERIARIKECMSNDELYIFDERLGLAEKGIQEDASLNQAAFRAVQDYRLERNKEIFFELWYYCLKNFSHDEKFRHYLNEERKISDYRIEKFDLFYIGNYYQVSSHLKKTFPITDLQRAGLFNEKENFIFFNHRMIIPYKYKNQIVYLRGRFFDENGNFKTDQNKYLGLRNDELNLNTPKRFFNIDITERMVKDEHLYITEGEFDTIVMSDIGFNSIAIAGVGNIPSDKWLRRLLPFTIFLCPDNDEAGKQLTKKLSEKFLQWDKEIFIKKIKAKDATELVKEMVA